jgi:hypothetical protein
MKTLPEIINHHRALSENLREYAQYAELNVQSPADLLRIIDTAAENYAQLLDELDKLDVTDSTPENPCPHNSHEKLMKDALNAVKLVIHEHSLKEEQKDQPVGRDEFGEIWKNDNNKKADCLACKYADHWRHVTVKHPCKGCVERIGHGFYYK